MTTRDAYANLTLPGLLRDRRLGGRDAAFATELSYGTLRMRGALDPILAAAAGRELETIDDDVLDLLRLGAYQLLYLRVPAHAAVSTTVDLAPPRATGFANAVLRAVSATDRESWLARVTPADPLAALAIRHSHPDWIVAAFRDALGGDLIETEAALAADNVPPPVHLAARAGEDRDALAVEVGGEPGRWSPRSIVLDSGDPGLLPAVRRGRAGVQDEGSQLVALAAATAELPGTDARWLDLCAGPGGKAALLGEAAATRGARVLAVELHPHRATLVQQSAGGDPVTVVVADGTVPAWADGSFDRALVDAPCSGLGSLRRRPEARWRRTPGDLPTMSRLQGALLTSALAAIRPGGTVLYATCSPHLAETRVVVADVLRRTGAALEDVRPLLPGVEDLGVGPTVQLWPHRHGTDGMFLALLRRIGG